MKTIFTLIFALFLLGSFTSSAQTQGEDAPEFTLNKLGGGEFKLSDQKGKVVFIFWLGYNCTFCKSVAPSVQSDIISKYTSEENLITIGIDTWNGTSAQVINFKNQTGLNVTYLLSGSSTASTYSTSHDRLAVIDKNGVLSYKGTQNASSTIQSAKTAIDEALKQIVTDVVELKGNSTTFENYPNPFNYQTTIKFKVENKSMVNLDLYDLSGKKVREITNREYSPGEHQIQFQKADLRNGLYFLRYKNDQQVYSRKMVIQ